LDHPFEDMLQCQFSLVIAAGCTMTFLSFAKFCAVSSSGIDERPTHRFLRNFSMHRIAGIVAA